MNREQFEKTKRNYYSEGPNPLNPEDRLLHAIFANYLKIRGIAYSLIVDTGSYTTQELIRNYLFWLPIKSEAKTISIRAQEQYKELYFGLSKSEVRASQKIQWDSHKLPKVASYAHTNPESEATAKKIVAHYSSRLDSLGKRQFAKKVAALVAQAFFVEK